MFFAAAAFSAFAFSAAAAAAAAAFSAFAFSAAAAFSAYAFSALSALSAFTAAFCVLCSRCPLFVFFLCVVAFPARLRLVY